MSKISTALGQRNIKGTLSCVMGQHYLSKFICLLHGVIHKVFTRRDFRIMFTTVHAILSSNQRWLDVQTMALIFSMDSFKKDCGFRQKLCSYDLQILNI